MKKTVILLVIAAVAAAAWGYSIWPREATVFAERFDRGAYSRLPIGASKSEASRALGRPFTERTYTLRERWLYCLSDERPVVGERSVLTTTGEIAVEECPAIEFDQAGRVADLTRFPETLKGSDTATVRSALGDPAVIRHGGKFAVWYYSKARSENDTYEQVTLTFDGRGRVVDKNVSLMAD